VSLASRAKAVNAKRSELTAIVTLYSTSDGGRRSPISPGFGCPCLKSKDTSIPGWDGWPKLQDTEMCPGETRTLGFVFLSGEIAAHELTDAGTFYLWEGKFIGEAKVV